MQTYLRNIEHNKGDDTKQIPAGVSSNVDDAGSSIANNKMKKTPLPMKAATKRTGLNPEAEFEKHTTEMSEGGARTQNRTMVTKSISLWFPPKRERTTPIKSGKKSSPQGDDGHSPQNARNRKSDRMIQETDRTGGSQPRKAYRLCSVVDCTSFGQGGPVPDVDEFGSPGLR